VRIFVAGASGAIGRRLVPKLVAAGHEVTGMTRSEERAAGLREAGAATVVCDIYDRERVVGAVAETGAEAVVHELTALPDRLDYRKPDLFAAHNRLRTEGTQILIDAAHAAGSRRLVAQSIAFGYAPEGDRVKSEDEPLATELPGGLGEVVRAVAELERQVLSAESVEGVVLRYGFFYGPGTDYAADGSYARRVRKRRYPVVGHGHGLFSFVHVDDAADATVAAIERGAPGVYNVVDDDPAPMRHWLPIYAEALGAAPPRRVPRWVARLAAGKAAIDYATTMRGAWNEKAKRELGWHPAHPTWRRGFAESLGAGDVSA
jgi:2-alkyl-3-oxoalkanoate reductase